MALERLNVLEPKPVIAGGALNAIESRVRKSLGQDIEMVRLTPDGAVIPNRTGWRIQPMFKLTREKIDGIVDRIAKVRRQENEYIPVYASVLAVIPTYETESEVNKTVESLLLQSRQIDQVVVIINGPGESVELCFG